MKDKKAAMEMSVGTIVTIVLLMSVLVLGLVLIQKIFNSGTESVDSINNQVRSKLNNLFSEEDSSIVILLGSSKVAEVKADSSSFGVVFGARTIDGTSSSRERLQYRISLQNDSDCINKNSKSFVESWFNGLNNWQNFDGYDGDKSESILRFSIPKGTALCDQKVYIDVKDNKLNKDVGGAYFTIKVVRKGLF
ncbi:hypothetical protein GYA25_01040 [Candidatus Woesearchaeota archaeon]|jgi:hypothetical protein|nr:hypothetical protein [Candidatus Woesearchaeota archaeon]